MGHQSYQNQGQTLMEESLETQEGKDTLRAKWK